MNQQARRVRFESAAGVRVRGDVKLLRIVLENLLGSAWKYTGRHEEARIEFGVRRIIHRHGGRIWAEAEPGKGATFFFTPGGLRFPGAIQASWRNPAKGFHDSKRPGTSLLVTGSARASRGN